MLVAVPEADTCSGEKIAVVKIWGWTLSCVSYVCYGGKMTDTLLYTYIGSSLA